MKPRGISRLEPAVLIALAIMGIAGVSEAAPLTAGEIAQIETDLGITFSQAEKDDIAAIAKPDLSLPQWRIDAEARIAQHRMAELSVQVECSTDLANWSPVDPDDVSGPGLTLVDWSVQVVGDGYGPVVEHVYSFEIPAAPLPSFV